MKDPLKIAVIYSVTTNRAKNRRYRATDEDTRESAEETWQALIEKGASTALVPIEPESIQTIKNIKADCIFNMIEWDGLDLPLAVGAFDFLLATGIPFTGATKENYILANDKLLLKDAIQKNYLPTPNWQSFKTGDEPIQNNFSFPVIVKLSLEHCSVGLDKDAVVDTREQLSDVVNKRIADFSQPVLVEEFIQGTEFQVTILETKSEIRMLPPAEIVFKRGNDREFLTFESRWDETHPDYEQSTVRIADLSHDLLGKLEKISLDTFTKLGYRDYARLDVRLRGRDFYILEANANPGLGDSDDYGMTLSYKAAGMKFADFIWAIAASCLSRSGKANLMNPPG